MGESTVIASLILFNIFFVAFIGGIIVFVRQYRIKKKIHEEELKMIDLLHKQELLQMQAEIQKETMKHIGREIHDNVGQKLTLSSLYLQQLNYENKAPNIEENINTINEIINESLNDLRRLSKSLTDDVIEQSTIFELIENEISKINDLKPFKIVLKNNVKQDDFTYQTKSILLRVVQEFLQNSIKHAECEQVIIELSIIKSDLVVFLKDDGKGFDTKAIQSKGIGLRNMKKRIEMLKGTFDVKSNSEGTSLNVKIPSK